MKSLYLSRCEKCGGDLSGVEFCSDGNCPHAEKPSLLDARRRDGLCSRCGEPLAENERALEGIGGSYVRCDDCVSELQRGCSCVGAYEFEKDCPLHGRFV